MLQQRRVKWISGHVPGHQDDDPTAFHDRWVIIIIEIDRVKLNWVDLLTSLVKFKFK
jgi:hypothetical protein